MGGYGIYPAQGTEIFLGLLWRLSFLDVSIIICPGIMKSYP